MILNDRPKATREVYKMLQSKAGKEKLIAAMVELGFTKVMAKKAMKVLKKGFNFIAS